MASRLGSSFDTETHCCSAKSISVAVSWPSLKDPAKLLFMKQVCAKKTSKIQYEHNVIINFPQSPPNSHTDHTNEWKSQKRVCKPRSHEKRTLSPLAIRLGFLTRIKFCVFLPFSLQIKAVMMVGQTKLRSRQTNSCVGGMVVNPDVCPLCPLSSSKWWWQTTNKVNGNLPPPSWPNAAAQRLPKSADDKGPEYEKLVVPVLWLGIPFIFDDRDLFCLTYYHRIWPKYLAFLFQRKSVQFQSGFLWTFFNECFIMF